MAYNWQMGAAPGVPAPSPATPPMRRPVGGRPIGRQMVRLADGRIIPCRAPGTRLYIPGYHDAETEHAMNRADLGLAIPIIPVIGALASLNPFGGGPDKKKWAARVKAVKAATAAGDLVALDRMANVHSAWGQAYNPIRTMARKAAAAIRAKLATTTPVGVPNTSAPAPAPAPVTLVPQIPGIVPVPITYIPPAPAPESTEMVPPTPSGGAAPAGGFDMKSLALPIGIGLGLLVLSGGFGGRRSR